MSNLKSPLMEVGARRVRVATKIDRSLSPAAGANLSPDCGFFPPQPGTEPEPIYPDIRLVHRAGGNPFHYHQDLNRLRRASQRPETIVVHEPRWTATLLMTAYCPATAWPPRCSRPPRR
jgi:anaerobic selenocysteine-containing dehydrogenase